MGDLPQVGPENQAQGPAAPAGMGAPVGGCEQAGGDPGAEEGLELVEGRLAGTEGGEGGSEEAGEAGQIGIHGS